MPNLQAQVHNSNMAATLLDMPPGVLQHIMWRCRPFPESSEWPLPKDGNWRGSAVARRVPAHILPGSLAACTPMWRAALAVVPTAVRVQRRTGTTAADYEQQFGACAASVRALELGPLPADFDAARCLQLASPQLHSLILEGEHPWAWVGQLPRFTRLERLSVARASFDLSGEEAAMLGSLPLRQLVLHLDWPEDDMELPGMPLLETLSITVTPDVDAWRPTLPAGGELEWLGTGRLCRQVVHQVVLAPPPPVLTGLVELELCACEHGWCTSNTFAQMSRITRLALQCSRSLAGQDAATADFSALPLLRELSLAGEKLTDLPAGVAGLQHLSVLDLTDNRLSSLPPGPYLGSLRQLSLAGNPVVTLPLALEAATGLELLDLTGCAPLAEAGMLAKLTNLNAVYFALELGWTAQDSIDMPIGAHEAMRAELASLEMRFAVVAALNSALERLPQELPTAVNTSRRLPAFGRHYDLRALWG